MSLDMNQLENLQRNKAYERLAQRLEDESLSVRRMLRIQDEISKLRQNYDPVLQDYLSSMVHDLSDNDSVDLHARHNGSITESGIDVKLFAGQVIDSAQKEVNAKSDALEITESMLASQIELARDENTLQKFDAKFWKQRTYAALQLAERLQKDLSACRKETTFLKDKIISDKLDFQNQLAHMSAEITQSKIALQQELDLLRRERDKSFKLMEDSASDLKNCQNQLETERNRVYQLELSQDFGKKRAEEELITALKRARTDWDNERSRELEELREKVKSTIRDLEQRHKDNMNTLATAWETEKVTLLKDIEKREEDLLEAKVAFLREKSASDSDRLILTLKNLDLTLIGSSEEKGPSSNFPLNKHTDENSREMTRAMRDSKCEKRVIELEQELDSARHEIGIRTSHAESSLRRAELRENLLHSTQAELASAQKRIGVLEAQNEIAKLEQQKRDGNAEAVSKLEEQVARLNAQIINERQQFKSEANERKEEYEVSLNALRREMESKLTLVSKQYEMKMMEQTEAVAIESKKDLENGIHEKEIKFTNKIATIANQMLKAIDLSICSLVDEVRAASSISTVRRVHVMEESQSSDASMSFEPGQDSQYSSKQSVKSPCSEETQTSESESEISNVDAFFPDASGSSPSGLEVNQKLVDKISHLENLTNAATMRVKEIQRVNQAKSEKRSSNLKISRHSGDNFPNLIISETFSEMKQEPQSRFSQFESALGIPQSLANQLENAFLEEDQGGEHMYEFTPEDENEEPKRTNVTGNKSKKSKSNYRPIETTKLRANGVKKSKPNRIDFKFQSEPDESLKDMENRMSSLKVQIRKFSQFIETDFPTSESKTEEVYEQFANIASSCISTVDLCVESVRTFARSRASLIRTLTERLDRIEQLHHRIQDLQDKGVNESTEIKALRLQIRTLNQELLTTKQFAEETKLLAKQSSDKARREADMAFQQVTERIRIAGKESYDRAYAEAESLRVKDQLCALTEQTGLNLKIRELQIELERCQKECEASKRNLQDRHAESKKTLMECSSAKENIRQYQFEVERMQSIVKEKDEMIKTLKNDCQLQQQMVVKSQKEVEQVRLDAQREISARIAETEMRARRAESDLSVVKVELASLKVKSDAEMNGLRQQIDVLNERENEMKQQTSNHLDRNVTAFDSHYRYEEIERQAKENTERAQREVAVLKQTIEHLRREMEETVSAFSSNSRSASLQHLKQIEDVKIDIWKKAQLNFELELNSAERRAGLAVRLSHELWINYLRRFPTKNKRNFDEFAQNLLLESETKTTQWLAKTRLGPKKLANAICKRVSDDDELTINQDEMNTMSALSSQDICGSEISSMVKELVDDAFKTTDSINSDISVREFVEQTKREDNQIREPTQNGSMNAWSQNNAATSQPELDRVLKSKSHESEFMSDSTMNREPVNTPMTRYVQECKSDLLNARKGSYTDKQPAYLFQNSPHSQAINEGGKVVNELKEILEAEKLSALTRDHIWEQEVQRRLQGSSSEKAPPPSSNNASDMKNAALTEDSDEASVGGLVGYKKSSNHPKTDLGEIVTNDFNQECTVVDLDDAQVKANHKTDPEKRRNKKAVARAEINRRVNKAEKKIRPKQSEVGDRQGSPTVSQRDKQESTTQTYKALDDAHEATVSSPKEKSFKTPKQIWGEAHVETNLQPAYRNANEAKGVITPSASLTYLETRVKQSKMDPTPPSRLSKAFAILGPTPHPVTITEDGYWKFK